MIAPWSPLAPLVDPKAGFLPTMEFALFLQALTKKLVGSTTYDPPNLAAGATTTKDVTVTGATFGYEVGATFSLDTQGVMLSAAVKSQDVVTVTLFNPTAGAINLASGTLTAYARQP